MNASGKCHQKQQCNITTSKAVQQTNTELPKFDRKFIMKKIGILIYKKIGSKNTENKYSSKNSLNVYMKYEVNLII